MAWKSRCSTCKKTFPSQLACANHILEVHARSGKGGEPIPRDFAKDPIVHHPTSCRRGGEPDYSEAAFEIERIYGVQI